VTVASLDVFTRIAAVNSEPMLGMVLNGSQRLWTLENNLFTIKLMGTAVNWKLSWLGQYWLVIVLL